MKEERGLGKMVIRFITAALEAVLLWSFLRALPVISPGNVAGIALSAVLIAITVFFDGFKRLISHLWSRGGTRVLLILLAVVIVLGIVYCAVLSYFMVRAINEGDKNQKADAVIVLGCQIKGDRPSRMLRFRLDKAYEYLKENEECVCIVSGGKGYDEDYTEAEVMKNYLVEKGIDPARIIEEGESTSTRENMFNSKQILEDMGITGQVCFVSDGYHIYRAGLIAKDQGLDAFGLPAKTEARFLPSFWVREWMSLTYYFLTK